MNITNETNSTNSNGAAWHAFRMLCWREIVRFLRQRNRVIGAVGQPILFWLLFGAGLHGSFRVSDADQSGQSFLVYYIPGTLTLILLFTAIFSTISIIEDRREGFLQSVLVAPVPRWSIVLGKTLGGSILALGQALVFLVLALLTQLDLMPPLQLIAIVVLLFLIAFSLTSLGIVMAWRMESTQGFHAIMNLLLMPMWLLSGAFFPVPPASAAGGQLVLHWIMRLNPLTYSVAGLRELMGSGGVTDSFWAPTAQTCWAVTIILAVGAFWMACRISRQRVQGDLQ